MSGEAQEIRLNGQFKKLAICTIGFMIIVVGMMGAALYQRAIQIEKLDHQMKHLLTASEDGKLTKEEIQRIRDGE